MVRPSGRGQAVDDEAQRLAGGVGVDGADAMNHSHRLNTDWTQIQNHLLVNALICV